MSKILTVKAREILDSRGNPTISVKVETEKGAIGVASVPSGASTGSKEALELRDKNTKYADNWYGAKGVMTAVDNVNNIISKKIVGKEVTRQKEVDKLMIDLDGTETKKNLGANAILGVSLAVARAAANERKQPFYRYIQQNDSYVLPLPMLNVLNGGAHASNTVDFQEFMIMPLGAKTTREALQMANFIFHNLAKILKRDGHGVQVGDEGGFAPNCKSHEEVLDYLVEAIKVSGYEPSVKKGPKSVAIALDAAASEIYDKNKKLYVFKKLKAAIEQKRPGFEILNNVKLEYTTDELINYFGKLIEKYPIISIEDGLDEEDWKGFKKMTARFGKKVQIVADDLTVTNPKLLQKAIKEKSMNSILIKLNQIGTLSETIDTINLAKKANMTCVVSHRSGETEDTTIVDLAVALSTGQIKTGSLSRTDRVAKYNRLLEIEEELESKAKFAGIEAFYNLD